MNALFDLAGGGAIVTGPVVFFAAPASDHVNDQVLVVDGGWLAQ
jgi:hypothetical protein